MFVVVTIVVLLFDKIFKNVCSGKDCSYTIGQDFKNVCSGNDCIHTIGQDFL